jgi:hypothetical protein
MLPAFKIKGREIIVAAKSQFHGGRSLENGILPAFC